jgi:hypothetical protein
MPEEYGKKPASPESNEVEGKASGTADENRSAQAFSRLKPDDDPDSMAQQPNVEQVKEHGGESEKGIWSKFGLSGTRSDEGFHSHQVSLLEVESLIKWASERGIGGASHNDILTRLSQATSVCKLASDDSREQSAIEKLLPLYAELVVLVKTETEANVTGKTIVESRDRHKHLLLLYALTFSLLIVAIGTESIGLWVKDGVDQDQIDPFLVFPWLSFSNLAVAHEYVLSILGPFFWGGLGACTYLLKRVSDFVQTFTFDLDRFPGWQTRVLLGFLLGGIVAYLFFPAFQSQQLGATATDAIKPNVLAYLTGLGTKVVYGAIEKLIDILVEKFSLGRDETSK